MPTPFERLQRALIVGLGSAITHLSDVEQVEILIQGIAEYSASNPRLKTTTLSFDGSSVTYDLPEDFMHVHEIRGASGLLPEVHLSFDYANAEAREIGQWREHGRSFLRFQDAPDAGSATLYYWGFHAEDGSTLSRRDVERIKPLLLATAYETLATEKTEIGRVQAGPVGWDDGTQATVYSAKAAQLRQEYARVVKFRPYGTYSRGADFNTRESVITGAGESL